MAIENGRIRCSRCREQKELNLFPKSVAAQGSGSCKACSLYYSQQWRQRNKERVAARKRERYQKDPVASAAKAREYRARKGEFHTEAQRAWLRSQTIEKRRSYALKKYGLSTEKYQEILLVQGGRCAICEVTPEDHGRYLFVDHCHSTGAVRGLLCHNCNSAIGHLRDDPKLLRRAIKYLGE